MAKVNTAHTPIFHKPGFGLPPAALTQIILRMRINLTTPFAEKDAVKALGARWDATRKLWYITDVADLSPFQRWLPKETTLQESAVPGKPARAAPVPTGTTASVTSSHSFSEVPHCGCDALPWEDCPHTMRGGRGSEGPTANTASST